MFNEQELDRLREVFRNSGARVMLTFHAAGDESPFGTELLSAARQLEEATDGAVRLERGDGKDVPATPAISVGCGDRQNIRYLALPTGQEAGPFLEMLAACARPGSGPVTGLEVGPAGPAGPVEILVFIARQCPVCPQAVRAALLLSLSSPQVSVTVVDAAEFPDLAARFHVRSVPVTVLDGGMTLVGAEPVERLAELVLFRDTAEYQAAAFRSLAEAGRFADAAERILGGGAVRHFVDAWQKSTTATRIELLLTAEAVLESDRTGLDQAVSDLLGLLGSDDKPLKGDTADLLRRIAHPSSARSLLPLLDDPDPDVAEVAAEALKAIEERSRSS